MRWNPEGGRPPAKVLLIQLRRIGDAVLVTPALDALGKDWPEARLHLLTSDPVPDLFAGDSRISVLWTRPSRRGLKGLALDLRRERFDVVFDFQSLPLTALLARFTRGYAVGFGKRGRTWLYHRPVSLSAHRGTDYAADHKLDLLRAVGLDPRLGAPRLEPPASPSGAWGELPAGARVALVPVSPRPHKRWALPRFVESARRLHALTGAVFLVAGGPGEGHVLSRVAAGLEGVPHRVREFERLAPFAAALSEARLFLGNDNGPRHVAAALGVATLAYFGPQNPSHWTPPRSPLHRVIWEPGRGRGGPVRPDLQLVAEDPDAVAQAGAELLSRTSVIAS
jgi:ADP-heptose:LPS heptosyltransferase